MLLNKIYNVIHIIVSYINNFSIHFYIEDININIFSISNFLQELYE